MDTAARLVLNDRVFRPQRATLSLRIATEGPHREQGTWQYGERCLSAMWMIDIVVDEHSGEDAAPAPSFAYSINDGTSIPPLNELPGTSLHTDDRTTEAWYGNDAPALTANTVTFGGWISKDQLAMRWTAKFDDWDTRMKDAQFLFEGPVRFAGIRMQVKNAADARAFLLLAAPRIELTQLQVEWGDWVDYGDGFPPERRKWLNVSWSRR